MFTTELQYIVIRYMMNDLADEAANVGIVAIADDPPKMLYQFLEDPTVKSRNDIRIRKEIVDRFASFISTQKQDYDRKAVPAAIVFEQLREFGAGVVRTNATRSVLTNDIKKEVELLFNQWVKPFSTFSQRSAGPRDPLGGLRKKASSALVKAFREGYGTLKRNTFRRQYEVKGAVHRNLIDLAMVGRDGNKRREHLFHHVLVFPDAEETFTQAAGLCWRWEDIRETNHVNRDLTAVLYERAGQHVKGVHDAAELFKKSDVKVARLQELPKLAQDLKGQRELLAK